MNAKQTAGQRGGQSTVKRHGREHMQKIGKRGAAVTWSRYYLAPVGLNLYAMVERATDKIKIVKEG